MFSCQWASFTFRIYTCYINQILFTLRQAATNTKLTTDLRPTARAWKIQDFGDLAANSSRVVCVFTHALSICVVVCTCVFFSYLYELINTLLCYVYFLNFCCEVHFRKPLYICIRFFVTECLCSVPFFIFMCVFVSNFFLIIYLFLILIFLFRCQMRKTRPLVCWSRSRCHSHPV